MAENAGGSAAPAETSPSFASHIGEMFGDFSEAEPESDAGAPPLETSETPASSEGTAASAPAGEPPAVADGSSVPDPNTPAPTDQDPFEGSTPHLAYTVDGQERTLDGITVLKDGTAIIDNPETVQRLQRMAGERDHLFEKDKTQYEKYSGLERMTSWDVPTGQRDANGKIVMQTLTGQKAVEEKSVYMAQHVAKTISYETAFDTLAKDATAFAKLYQIVTDERGEYGPAGQQYVIPNPQGFTELKREAAMLARESAFKMREHLSTLAAPVPAAPAPLAPVSEHAMSTIDKIIADFKITGVTADDKTFLAAQFPQYVETTDKGRSVNPLFVDAIKRAGQLSASQAKVAVVATDAAKNNAARRAAASHGKGKQPQRTAVTQEPARTRSDDFDTAWDLQQSAAAGLMRRRAAGQ